MATSQSGNKQAEEDPSDIKRKLAWRMGIAGLMIAGLLGALALFDYLSQEDETVPSAPQFTEPVPVAKKMVTQPVTPAEPVADQAKEENKAAIPESSAPPVDKAAPALEPPPRPEVAAQPALPRASQPSGRPAVVTIQPAPSTSVKPVEPRAQSEPAARAELPVAAAPPRLFSGYALQAGVLPIRAEPKNCMPGWSLKAFRSTIEARVQVGPFKTKAEAEAAREKMKALGIEAVMLPPKNAKR